MPNICNGLEQIKTLSVLVQKQNRWMVIHNTNEQVSQMHTKEKLGGSIKEWEKLYIVSRKIGK